MTRTGGFVAKVIRLVTKSPVNHAGVFVGDGQIVEAEPHGARVGSTGQYPDALWSSLELTDEQRRKVVETAFACVGVPYNYIDIACLFAVHALGWRVPRFIRRRVATDGRLICSQLVDVCLDEAGVHLFTDGRPSGDVTPEDVRTAGGCR